ncbi:glycosyltransferase [Amycolatopsis sp. BJA-103]|uniref:glycosyltransferase n=1 Tax=Amycolatopsis sp. BJA-103 TaxID=1911175 RepID=UPI000C76A545|nr:glycosyltransferase [Amycolatopsis sp. BJA-103]AUI58090.1 glycosyl transferase [Amycolatopsis sp. BJA-103]PNE15624.1 glycosyl transferase [Amycolatopsis sp. BJA-103]
MGRFLFVTPPLTGHVNPAVGVAAALTARGHQVAWAGQPEVIRSLAGDGAEVFPCAVPRGLPERDASLKGPAAFRFLWEEFLIPLAEAMAPGVRAAIGRFRPQVVIADQQAIAGGLVADGLGLPWVTSATTSAELVDPLAGMPKVAAWLDDLLDGLRTRIDGGPADPRMSPHGVLAFTTRELLGPATLPKRVRLVGPSIGGRAAIGDFPWDRLDPSVPTVFVTLGTANADAAGDFLAAAARGLSRVGGIRTVIADPGGAVGRTGDTVLVVPRVPQMALLARVDAVVCHGGHNTVCESLWHGVPLVVAPIRDDQPIVAGQVVDAGAGVRVRFGRAKPDRIATAVTRVLDDPAYRSAAEKVGASFREAGGAATAADHLEALLL